MFAQKVSEHLRTIHVFQDGSLRRFAGEHQEIRKQFLNAFPQFTGSQMCIRDSPAIDPEILFRMLLVGYLYGIKSEARLEEEINYNIAYKWFCGLDLTQKSPDATTISQNRQRFRDNNIAEQIFNEILRQCVEKGLVGGAILYTDSTHIKAKANKHKKKQVEVAVTPKAYLAELDAQVDQEREDDEHRGG